MCGRVSKLATPVSATLPAIYAMGRRGERENDTDLFILQLKVCVLIAASPHSPHSPARLWLLGRSKDRAGWLRWKPSVPQS